MSKQDANEVTEFGDHDVGTSYAAAAAADRPAGMRIERDKKWKSSCSQGRIVDRRKGKFKQGTRD